MVKFEDLKLTKPNMDSVENTSILNFKDVEITIRKKITIDEVMKMTSYILSEAEDERMSYFHPVRFNVLFVNAIIEFYTDIEIPEDMTIADVYDMVIDSGLYTMVREHIEDDVDGLFMVISKTAKEIYAYRSSLVGIMEKVTNDYSALTLDSEQIKENLNNPESLELLRNIMDRFG